MRYQLFQVLPWFFRRYVLRKRHMNDLEPVHTFRNQRDLADSEAASVVSAAGS